MPEDDEDEVLVVNVDIRLVVPEVCNVVDLLDSLPGTLWVEDLHLPVLGIIGSFIFLLSVAIKLER